jgi:hypothetical protein
MENSIKIFMDVKDANELEKIFKRRDNPQFIIVNRFDMSDTCVQMELLAESTMILWYLAKEVQMMQTFDSRMDKIIEDLSVKLNIK